MKKKLLAAVLFLGIAATSVAQTQTLSEGVIIEKGAPTDFVVPGRLDSTNWSYVVRDLNTGVHYRMVPTFVDLPIGVKVAYDLGGSGADVIYGMKAMKGECGTCGTKVFRILGKA